MKQGNTISSERQPLTCFLCGQPGHISPDCPSRVKKEFDLKKEPEDKSGKPEKKSYKNNRISIPDLQDCNILPGKIGDYEVPFLLDSGAQISVVPIEFVPEAAKTGETVKVKGFGGEAVSREVAKVKIHLGSKILDERVVLASSCDLEGKGILAVDLRSSKLWEIIAEFKEDFKSVNIVETRAQAKDRVESEKEDELTVEKEKPVLKHIGIEDAVEEVVSEDIEVALSEDCLVRGEEKDVDCLVSAW